jgi:Sulphur transport
MNTIVLASAGFAIAFVCASLMGYAIQRGATCMVAAIDEIVTKRRVSRLVALTEASVWVAGGLVLANSFGVLKMPPTAYPINVSTIAGGILLGLGALINRACVFGSIARLGSGEWAYLLTPVGFFLGCLGAGYLMTAAAPTAVQSPLFAVAPLLIVPLALFAAWRGLQALQAMTQRQFAAHIWSPHHATMVIGLAFVVMLLTVGSWAYTEALASLAQGMASNVSAKLLLFFGLLAGALFGGTTAGRMRFVAPTVGGLIRCVVGGAMMGAGSLLIPGSNDGLILLGLPLLQPHALVALISMALAIVGGMAIERKFARR